LKLFILFFSTFWYSSLLKLYYRIYCSKIVILLCSAIRFVFLSWLLLCFAFLLLYLPKIWINLNFTCDGFFVDQIDGKINYSNGEYKMNNWKKNHPILVSGRKKIIRKWTFNSYAKLNICSNKYSQKYLLGL
jgi:hypothetical protein